MSSNQALQRIKNLILSLEKRLIVSEHKEIPLRIHIAQGPLQLVKDEQTPANFCVTYLEEENQFFILVNLTQSGELGPVLSELTERMKIPSIRYCKCKDPLIDKIHYRCKNCEGDVIQVFPLEQVKNILQYKDKNTTNILNLVAKPIKLFASNEQRLKVPQWPAHADVHRVIHGNQANRSNTPLLNCGDSSDSDRSEMVKDTKQSPRIKLSSEDNKKSPTYSDNKSQKTSSASVATTKTQIMLGDKSSTLAGQMPGTSSQHVSMAQIEQSPGFAVPPQPPVLRSKINLKEVDETIKVEPYPEDTAAYWLWKPPGVSLHIYYHSKVHRDICKHALDNKNEVGGVLVGYVRRNTPEGNPYIIITDSIPAKFAHEERTTLTFTSESQRDFLHTLESDPDYRGRQIVGWYHTHPNFDIFLSEPDLFIHENYFRKSWQVALVIDPLKEKAGFFTWNKGKILKPNEPLAVFNIFDKAWGWDDLSPVEEKKTKGPKITLTPQPTTESLPPPSRPVAASLTSSREVIVPQQNSILHYTIFTAIILILTAFLLSAVYWPSTFGLSLDFLIAILKWETLDKNIIYYIITLILLTGFAVYITYWWYSLTKAWTIVYSSLRKVLNQLLDFFRSKLVKNKSELQRIRVSRTNNKLTIKGKNARLSKLVSQKWLIWFLLLSIICTMIPLLFCGGLQNVISKFVSNGVDSKQSTVTPPLEALGGDEVTPINMTPTPIHSTSTPFEPCSRFRTTTWGVRLYYTPNIDSKDYQVFQVGNILTKLDNINGQPTGNNSEWWFVVSERGIQGWVRVEEIKKFTECIGAQ
ncbi:MAG: hypothetical protein DPW11_03215 [bacterium]|nr:Mov34/MPN/PAD-1 family protein [Anaerolineales bacterium]MCQ3944758.1 hypothetical protein [bacterium]